MLPILFLLLLFICLNSRMHIDLRIFEQNPTSRLLVRFRNKKKTKKKQHTAQSTHTHSTLHYATVNNMHWAATKKFRFAVESHGCAVIENAPVSPIILL